jgi:hypothetical protein
MEVWFESSLSSSSEGLENSEPSEVGIKGVSRTTPPPATCLAGIGDQLGATAPRAGAASRRSAAASPRGTS